MFNKKKYEPKIIDELTIEDAATKQRLQDYADGLRTGHILMQGPQGTGKSSAANVIAQTRTGSDLEAFTEPFEGATFTQSDFDKILNEWSWQSIHGVEVPVTVINEVDLLSPALLEQLKAFLDDHGQIGQIIVTTNNPHKLSPAQKDRFDVIELPSLSPDAFAPRIRKILESEGVIVSDTYLQVFMDTTNGSWRDALAAAEDMVLESKRKRKRAA